MQGGAFPIRAHLPPFHFHLPRFHSFHAKSPPRFRRNWIAFMLKAENGGDNACWQPLNNHWTTIEPEQALYNHWTNPVQPIKQPQRLASWPFWHTASKIFHTQGGFSVLTLLAFGDEMYYICTEIWEEPRLPPFFVTFPLKTGFLGALPGKICLPLI